ncbi:unnamed protein product [Blepharisma stoltei]|uniref:Protein kinase domain-containing protein n=1 Tax=Blepharisma stoltei TaxID=1481888 RepID=A0AAU9JJZ7_9CILI|nr:unnamed protein product [Blepharisma stoltei]
MAQVANIVELVNALKSSSQGTLEKNFEAMDIARQVLMSILKAANKQETLAWVPIAVSLRESGYMDAFNLISNALQASIKKFLYAEASGLEITALSNALKDICQLNSIDPLSSLTNIIGSLLTNRIRQEQDRSKAGEAVSSLCSLQFEKSIAEKVEELKVEYSDCLMFPCEESKTQLASQFISSMSQLSDAGGIKSRNPKNDYCVTISHKYFEKGNERVQVIVKSYTADDQRTLEKFTKEANIYARLSGNMSCFLKFYGAFFDMEGQMHRYNIVVEHCTTDLRKDIANRALKGLRYSPEEMTSYTKTLIEGFTYMSRLSIFHRDIKPENILLSGRTPKIIDFDASYTLDEKYRDLTSARADTLIGTKNYFSPELQAELDSRREGRRNEEFLYDPLKSDVFSLGLTLLEMASLQYIGGLSGQRYGEILEIIRSLKYDDWFKDILASMLQQNPASRPKFSGLIPMIPANSTTIFV